MDFLNKIFGNITIGVIIGNIVSLVGYIVYWKMRYTSSKKKLVAADVEIQISGIISMAILGTFSGLLNGIIGLCRGILALVIKNSKVKKAVFVLLIIAYLLLLKDFSVNWTCLLVVIASSINTYSIYYCNSDKQKLINILIYLMYGAFCFAVKNYVAFFFEYCSMITTAISYYKFKGENKN